tara:strand:- start:4411 stop:4692 length:282 start_codon:yes stop_codon:yes gene_type:complete
MSWDQIMSFLSGLSPMQYVLIGIGVVILFPYVSQIFKDGDNKKAEEETQDISDLVDKWDDFYHCCKKHNLEDACNLLDEIFPMFLGIKDEDDH